MNSLNTSIPYFLAVLLHFATCMKHKCIVFALKYIYYYILECVIG